MSSSTTPLLIRWSPGSVTVIDPVSGHRFEGENLPLDGSYRGRHAIVAIGQRSVFIRNLQVPNLPKDETARLLAIKVGPLVPLDPGEYSFGFRLGAESKGQGRTAVVGAVRTTTLRAIYRECEDAGIHVQMLVPIAFGSWLAARAQGHQSCAAISVEGRSLNIDLIEDGELCYSRSIALPDSAEEMSDEIACTFEIAQILPSPVLALGSALGFPADFTDHKTAIEHLLDPGAARLLFTLELPEQIERKSRNTQRAAAQRAIAALFVALFLGGLAFRTATAASAATKRQTNEARTSLDRAYALQSTAVAGEVGMREQKVVVDQAFAPAQTFSDVLHAINLDTTPGIWLTGLTMERGKPVTIRGSAVKQAPLTKLVAKLGKDPRFRNMKLSFATRAKIAQQTVIQFAVTGSVVGNLPIDEVPKAPGAK